MTGPGTDGGLTGASLFFVSVSVCLFMVTLGLQWEVELSAVVSRGCLFLVVHGMVSLVLENWL